MQIFLLLSIILAFFLLTTSISPHVQLGLYNKYLKQHGSVFALSLLTLLLVGSTGAYRLVSCKLVLQAPISERCVAYCPVKEAAGRPSKACNALIPCEAGASCSHNPNHHESARRCWCMGVPPSRTCGTTTRGTWRCGWCSGFPCCCFNALQHMPQPTRSGTQSRHGSRPQLSSS